MRKYCIALIAYLLFGACSAQRPGGNGPSAWGLDGDVWNKNQLLDWSWTGYNGKETPDFADPPIVANILDYGAVGDSLFDNSGPIQSAVEQAAAVGGGTVFVPAGRYRLRQRIVISSSNIVLKGEGIGASILYYDSPLSTIDNKNISAYPLQSPYSWSDGVIQIKGVRTGSENPSTLIGRVTSPSTIGSRTIQLDSTAGVQVGMWIRLLMSDVNGTLIRQLYGSAMERSGCKEECSGDLTGEVDMVRWMTRVAGVDDTTVTLQRPLPVSASPTWKSELHRVPESMPKHSGIRSLSVEFDWSPAPEHHQEEGRNAFFIDAAANAFLVDVEAINVDSAVLVRDSYGISVVGLIARSSTTRSSNLPFQGHIGVGIYDSSDVEIGYFDLQGEWIHDVSVRGTLMTVIHNGKGENVNLDTHRSAPYATLFSNIHLGKGARPFGTGGYLSRGFPSARFTTYYNIQSERGMPLAMPGATIAGNCTWGSGINFVGYWTGSSCPGYYIESFDYGTLLPEDLYGSMIDRKFRVRANPEQNMPGSVVATLATVLATPISPAPAPAGLEASREVKDVQQLPSAGDGTYTYISAPEFY